MGFNFSAIDGREKICVHCPEEDIAKSFLDAFNQDFPRHRFLPQESCWYVYGEDTCYFPNFRTSFRNMQYGNMKYAVKDGYEVISVYDLCECNELPICIGEVDIKSLFGME